MRSRILLSRRRFFLLNPFLLFLCLYGSIFWRLLQWKIGNLGWPYSEWKSIVKREECWFLKICIFPLNSYDVKTVLCILYYPFLALEIKSMTMRLRGDFNIDHHIHHEREITWFFWLLNACSGNHFHGVYISFWNPSMDYFWRNGANPFNRFYKGRKRRKKQQFSTWRWLELENLSLFGLLQTSRATPESVSSLNSLHPFSLLPLGLR